MMIFRNKELDEYYITMNTENPFTKEELRQELEGALRQLDRWTYTNIEESK